MGTAERLSANDAVAALAKDTGTSDVARWQWGRFHPLNMLHPLGRTGTPEEAASAVLFFASPLSDYVTGEVLICGGGLHF